MKCEIPACDSDSCLEPAPMKKPMETERVWGIGAVIKRNPLSRVVF